MPKTLSSIFILLLSSAPLAPLLAQAESITLIIEEFAPYSYTNAKTNEIQGYVTDKVQEILRRAGETGNIKSTSLARGLKAVKTEENTCLINQRRTAERENSFLWVGPLTTSNWVLYAKNTDDRVLKNIEDAKPYRIGSYKNSATGLELKDQGYKIEFAATDDENPNLLVMNRIDYWVVAEQRGKYIAEQQGYGGDISQIAKYKSIELYMLCHLAMSKQRISKFNRINKEIDSDGTMQKILQKNGIH